MPRLRIKDFSFDLCRFCWDDPDLELIANLAYTTTEEVKQNLILEERGSCHPNYDTCDLICEICNSPLTSDDNDAEGS